MTSGQAAQVIGLLQLIEGAAVFSATMLTAIMFAAIMLATFAVRGVMARKD